MYIYSIYIKRNFLVLFFLLLHLYVVLWFETATHTKTSTSWLHEFVRYIHTHIPFYWNVTYVLWDIFPSDNNNIRPPLPSSFVNRKLETTCKYWREKKRGLREEFFERGAITDDGGGGLNGSHFLAHCRFFFPCNWWERIITCWPVANPLLSLSLFTPIFNF